MQTNHISQFLLVDLLLSLEAAVSDRAAARVVTHSSGGSGCALARDHVLLLKGQYFWCLGQERWEVTSCLSASMATAKQARQLGDDRAFHRRCLEGGCKVKNVCAVLAAKRTDLGSNLARGQAQHGSDVSASLAVGVFRDGRGFQGPLHARRQVQETACGRPVQVITADRPTHAHSRDVRTRKTHAGSCEA